MFWYLIGALKHRQLLNEGSLNCPSGNHFATEYIRHGDQVADVQRIKEFFHLIPGQSREAEGI